VCSSLLQFSNVQGVGSMWQRQCVVMDGSVLQRIGSVFTVYCSVLAVCWQCVGSVLAVCWQCVGSVLAVRWQCVGSVLECLCKMQRLSKPLKQTQCLAKTLKHTANALPTHCQHTASRQDTRTQRVPVLAVRLSALPSNCMPVCCSMLAACRSMSQCFLACCSVLQRVAYVTACYGSLQQDLITPSDTVPAEKYAADDARACDSQGWCVSHM